MNMNKRPKLGEGRCLVSGRDWVSCNLQSRRLMRTFESVIVSDSPVPKAPYLC